MSQKLIAGNWKMNGLTGAVSEARALCEGLAGAAPPARVALCPPATLLAAMARTLTGSQVLVGGQDCHAEPSGAYTGDISAEMLADAGASLVILGHSERRAYHAETDAAVAMKARAALRAGLEPIVCVGETLDERQAGQTLELVTRQVRGSIPPEIAGRPFAVAYEPVWAIGTGLTPTLEQIEEVHVTIRAVLRGMLGEAGEGAPILYGGSVKPGNAVEILAVQDVGGALVGGASMKADDFLGIIRAAR